MIYVLYIAVGLVGLVALMALVGLLLRPDHTSTRTAEIPRPPEEVYAIIRDVERHPEWRSDLKRIEVLDDRRFREHGRQGAILFEIVEDSPPRRLITRIADDRLPFSGQWTIDVAPAPGGARVTVTEAGAIKNPVFRFLSRTVFSLSATLERYLRDLARRCGVGVGR